MKIYRINKRALDIEPHEIFLDKMAESKEAEMGVSQKKLEVPLKERISYILFGIFLLFALALFSKTFYLQVAEGKKLAVQAENNKGSISIIVPERGVIYDRNQNKLVSNSSVFDLVCAKSRFAVSSDEITGEINDISSIVSVDPALLFQKIQESDAGEVLMAEQLDHKSFVALSARINDFEGCKIQQNTGRNYLFGPVFSHVLGYTGRINKDEYADSAGYSINDYIGKIGIEKQYETYLRGVPGRAQIIKTAKGNQVGNEVVKEAEPGQNLVLNIDANLQKVIYESLEKNIKRVGAAKGAAVAMDPRNGAVLALVSYPSYDSNLFSGGISVADYNKLNTDPNQPLFNRALAAHYPTGSTIKPFEAAAALQEKIIPADKQINDIGYILVPSQYDPEVVYKFGGVEPHGWVDMRKAIAVSSNIYFYTIGGGYGDQKGLGPSRIKKYLSLFGWDQKTGIDLPGEYAGFIPDPAWKKQTKGASWVDGDTYNLSIGQSDLQTTPLQVASAYCAIANGGTLYKPQVVKKITDTSGKSIKEFEPQVIRSNFIDKENLQVAREGMRDAVSQPYGLSGSLRNLPVEVAVKTGTAQIGYQNHFNVWSSVFAPYENPEIVLVITVENVEGFGTVTFPVLRDAINSYFPSK